MDQLIATTTDMSRKLDKIAQWQLKATEIHSSHEQQIKALFNRVVNLENQMEDRLVMTAALQKILHRMN